MLEKNEASAKAGPGVLLGSGEPETHSRNTPKRQGRDGPAPLHLLVDHRRCRCVRGNGARCQCTPTVVSFKRNGSTFVGVRNPVWGHGAKVKEFLGSGKAAERYTALLWDELRALAWREHDRRERQKEARLREAIERNGGGR